MSHLDRLHGILAVMPDERKSNPVMYPACDFTELKYMSCLSDAATDRIRLSSSTLNVNIQNELVSTDALLKPGKYGEPTALILRCEKRPELEAMIVGDIGSNTAKKVYRPFYSSARYHRDPTKIHETGRLEDALDLLRLKRSIAELYLLFPDREEACLATTKMLISLCDLPVGQSFTINSITFSAWLTYQHPEKANSIWGMSHT